MARRGAKTKYHKSYARQAEVACAEGGFTDVKLAKLFGVSKSTINKWKHDHPEFSDSVKAGKEKYDTENVEDALLKRALGYKYNEITKEVDPLSKKVSTSKIVRKEVAGDVKAQTFWLRNRNRDRWPDTHKLDADVTMKKTRIVRRKTRDTEE